MWRVIGQDRVIASLEQGIKQGSIAHAYLLTGPRHIGKRTLAVDLAQAINCNGSEPPCGQCPSCQRIAQEKHADVVLTQLDSTAEIGIDTIKELQHLANLPPYEGRCKVFIIDDAEYLSTEAANRLLKILEEPPPKVLWLLLTSEEERLLPTVVSRCCRLELKPVPPGEMQKALTARYNIEPGKASLFARLSHGCPGWAISAEQDDALLHQRAENINKLASLLTANLEQRFAYAQELAAQFSKQRKSVIEIIDAWIGWWHDLMLLKGGGAESITNIDYKDTLEKQAGYLTLEETSDFIARLRRAKEQLNKNINPRLLLEWLMLNIPGRKS
jgi:DNA polymerase-3 subunit delta'